MNVFRNPSIIVMALYEHKLTTTTVTGDIFLSCFYPSPYVFESRIVHTF